MTSILRFYREHLKSYLPLIIGGTLLMVLAGMCQGLMVTTLKFVFEDNLGMGAPKAAAGTGDNYHFVVQTHGITHHRPSRSA